VGFAPILRPAAQSNLRSRKLKDRYQLTVWGWSEQNFPQALRIADRVFVIVHGKIRLRRPLGGRTSTTNDLMRKFYSRPLKELARPRFAKRQAPRGQLKIRAGFSAFF